MPTKPKDNGNLEAKLALRRYFLQRYANDSASVLDCCQGQGVLWGRLRSEFNIKSYFGVDLKSKPGRIKIDSVRILDQPGWPFTVIDVDTYGSPWRHWQALIKHLRHPATVFLTIGMVKIGGGNTSIESVMAMQIDLKSAIPTTLKTKADERFGLTYSLATAQQHGLEIVEAVESKTDSRTVRYVGVRLKPVDK